MPPSPDLSKEQREAIHDKAAREVVAEVIRLIYCNPKVPENLNAYVPSMSHDAAHTWDDSDGWVRRPLTQVTSKIAQKAVDEVCKHQPLDDEGLRRTGDIVTDVVHLDRKGEWGDPQRR